MPRYFFHVRRGQLTVIDREGMELNDFAEVARKLPCVVETLPRVRP